MMTDQPTRAQLASTMLMIDWTADRTSRLGRCRLRPRNCIWTDVDATGGDGQ